MVNNSETCGIVGNVYDAFHGDLFMNSVGDMYSIF